LSWFEDFFSNENIIFRLLLQSGNWSAPTSAIKTNRVQVLFRR